MRGKSWALGAIVGLTLAVGGLIVYRVTLDKPEPAAPAQTAEPSQGPASDVTVTITPKACDPNALTVAAGKVTFRIVNQSSRAVEWEILDGVMVVDERENIAPGFTQTLTTRLAPGSYVMTCGLLSNPRGTLTAMAPDGTTLAQPAPPSLKEMIGPIAEYKVYLMGEAAGLVEQTAALVEAIKAGDLEQAQALYRPAHVRYDRLEPITGQFGDLDAAINARADYYEQKEADPAFTGFHRLRYGLFTQQSLEGLEPLADRLLADVTLLQGRIQGLTPPPAAMVGGAATVIARLASGEIADDDLIELRAGIEGAEKIVTLLRPLTQKADRALSDQLDQGFAAVTDRILAIRQSGQPLQPADAETLRGQLAALAEALGKLRGVLGLG